MFLNIGQIKRILASIIFAIFVFEVVLYQAKAESIRIELREEECRKALHLVQAEKTYELELNDRYQLAVSTLSLEGWWYEAERNEYTIGGLTFTVSESGSIEILKAEEIQAHFKTAGRVHVNDSRVELNFSSFDVEAGTLAVEGDVRAEAFSYNGALFQNTRKLQGKSFSVFSTQFKNTGGNLEFLSNIILEVGEGFDNTDGKIHARGGVVLQTKDLQNENGSISGIETTQVSCSGNLTGKNGHIGANGKTILSLLTSTTVEHLGKVQGTTVEFQDKSDNPKTVIKDGGFFAEEEVLLKARSLEIPGVIIQSPLLELQVQDFLIDTIPSSERTIVRLDSEQDFALMHPYRTTGSFEFWQTGLLNVTSVEAAMEHLYGDGSGDLPAPKQQIRLQAAVQADKGLHFYTPEARIQLGDNDLAEMPEFLLQNSFLRGYANTFDLEKAVLATVNAFVRAPKGIYVGRLITDPTRRNFSTIFSHGQSSSFHPLSRYINNPVFDFLGQQIRSGIYDGQHLFTLPIAISNGSTLSVIEKSEFKGPLFNRGHFFTENLEIFTPRDSFCEASEIHVENNFGLNGGGSFHLRRHIGNITFTYRVRRRDAEQHSSFNYVSSGPSNLQIEGELFSDQESSITNKGCILYMYKKSPLIALQTSDCEASLFQKFFSISDVQEKRILELVDSKTFRSKIRFREITYPFNCHREFAGCHAASSFLCRSNNFAGAQRVFPAQQSTSTETITASHTLQGQISTPGLLITVGDEGLKLGSPNPYYIEPRDPIRDLMSNRLNLHTTRIAENLREDIARATTPQVFFKFSPRYWFDELQAQNFHRNIAGAVFVRTPTGKFERARPNSLFSISPSILLGSVRSECQEVLMRGYIYDNRPIDMELIKELHFNMREYLDHIGMEYADLEQALVLQNAQFPVPTKPMIFYQSLLNEENLEELSPYVVFPPAMLEEARSARGGNIRTHFLGIFPAHHGIEEMVRTSANNPPLQQALLEFAYRNPSKMLALEERAQEVVRLRLEQEQ
ncbi:MAG: hypothetical protein HOK20_00880 [Alphaproteobacteria bacterium]|nr:hypothetical protein [Alphaproteobacteria bacterium]